ncbi:MAG: M50 family metallopeptidase [Firmicutes bacterium]|nr:M50 family metallopeptidase [Bacillota bacterium]
MIPLGVLLGVPLRMHVAFPVMMAALLWHGQARALLMMLAALSLHEAGHALAARAAGQRFECIELMPFGGVARMDTTLALRPAEEICIALAGPFASLLFCLLTAAGKWTGYAAQDFLRSNLSLALINLLPALPLDGGRALRAALTARLGRAHATKLFVRVGVALGVLILALGVWAAAAGVVNPLLFLMGAYLAYAALKEKETLAAACVEALHGRAARLAREGMLPVRWLAVEKDAPPERLAARLTAGTYHLFVLVDGSLGRVGTMDEGEVLRQVLTKRIGPGM